MPIYEISRPFVNWCNSIRLQPAHSYPLYKWWRQSDGRSTEKQNLFSTRNENSLQMRSYVHKTIIFKIREHCVVHLCADGKYARYVTICCATKKVNNRLSHAKRVMETYFCYCDVEQVKPNVSVTLLAYALLSSFVRRIAIIITADRNCLYKSIGIWRAARIAASEIDREAVRRMQNGHKLIYWTLVELETHRSKTANVKCKIYNSKKNRIQSVLN